MIPATKLGLLKQAYISDIWWNSVCIVSGAAGAGDWHIPHQIIVVTELSVDICRLLDNLYSSFYRCGKREATRIENPI